MVAAAVGGLSLLDGLVEEERTPVCDAADDAAVCEDQGACCSSDAVFGRERGVKMLVRLLWDWWGRLRLGRDGKSE